MGYFDGTYFSSPYFDTGGVAVLTGHPHGYPRAWDPRNVEMPIPPAWLAMAERKRRRIEDETIAALLRAQAEARRRRMTISLALGLEVHP